MRKIILGLLSFGIWMPAFADDTDLYRNGPVEIPARIMILLDSSKSMTEKLSDCSKDRIPEGTNCEDNKLQMARKVLYDFLHPNSDGVDGAPTNLDMVWPDDLQIGFAQYLGEDQVVLLPLKALGAYDPTDAVETHREELIDTIKNDIDIITRTPLLTSYFEVVQYMLGNNTAFIQSPASSANGIFADGSEYSGVEQSICKDDGRVSIIVLTDGRSNKESTDNFTQLKDEGNGQTLNFSQAIEEFAKTQAELTDEMNASDVNCPSGLSTSKDYINTAFWNCADSIAELLHFSTGIDTHVIAYDLADEGGVLQNWATGVFKSASNAYGLSSAFSNIVVNTQSLDSTFTAVSPGVSVNQASRFSYFNEVYYSLFKPSGNRFWYGNLKKYSLQELLSGDLTNDVTGLFEDDARSAWWSVAEGDPDGGVVHLGGASAEIDDAYTSRNLFVGFDGLSVVNIADDVLADCPSPTETPSATGICRLRDHLYAQQFGEGWDTSSWDPFTNDDQANYETKVASLIDWLRGGDVFDELAELNDEVESTVRKLYGSALHASPVLVNYTSFGTDFAPLSLDNQENVAFVSTNDGKLYAVDSANGEEKFSYIPASMLTAGEAGGPPVEEMYDAIETGAEGSLIYGLDSPWQVWRQDNTKDGNITSGTADHVYMYGGMRRGGRDYIALDVTDAYESSSMEELFIVKGGEAGKPTEKMGQTWSVPTLGFIKYNGNALPVMFVGGGYDVGYDSQLTRPENPLGAQVYAIATKDVNYDSVSYNAGDVVWWASASGSGASHVQVDALTHSVTSRIKTIDKNSDGYTDYLYFGDLGGQLHRIDINNSLTDSSNPSDMVSASVVAQLGIEASGASSADGVFTDDRRFYHAPSVAIMREPLANGSYQQYIGIAIGSGWRANPLSDLVDDQMFFIKDKEPYNGGVDLPVIEYNSLVELAVVDEDGSTVSGSAEIPSSASVAAASGVRGPMLLTAEKVISTPLIIAGQMIFTSYYERSESEALAYLRELNEGLSADEQICSFVPGAAALYGYQPGTVSLAQQEINLPQNISSSLTAIIAPKEYLPPGGGDDGDDGDAPESQLIGLGGTKSFSNLPPVDLGNIRKTFWKRQND